MDKLTVEGRNKKTEARFLKRFDFVEFCAICPEYFETKIAKTRPLVATFLTTAKCVRRMKIRCDNFVRVAPKPPKRQTKEKKPNGAPDHGRQNHARPRGLE